METLKLGQVIKATSLSDEEFEGTIESGIFLYASRYHNGRLFRFAGIEPNSTEEKREFCRKCGVTSPIGNGDFPEIKTLEELTMVIEGFLPYCKTLTVDGVEMKNSSAIHIKSAKRTQISLI